MRRSVPAGDAVSNHPRKAKRFNVTEHAWHNTGPQLPRPGALRPDDCRCLTRRIHIDHNGIGVGHEPDCPAVTPPEENP